MSTIAGETKPKVEDELGVEPIITHLEKKLGGNDSHEHKITNEVLALRKDVFDALGKSNKKKAVEVIKNSTL